MAFTKRGLRFVQALEKFAIDKPIYFDTINFFNKIKFTEANDEKLKATMTVDSSMCSGFQVMHGGYIATVIDIMCGYAYFVKSSGKIGYTNSMHINFTSTASIGEKIVAEATTLKDGRSPVYETILYKENGVLVAKGTACFHNGNEEMQKLFIKSIGFDSIKTT